MKRFIQFAVVFLAGTWAGATAVLIVSPPARPVKVVAADPAQVGNENFAGVVHGTGWLDLPAEVQAVAEGRPFQSFRDTPAWKEAGDPPDHVYLWEYAKQATGANLPARDQGQVGSCVAFGCVNAVDHLQCVRVVKAKLAGRPPPEFKPLSPEVVYGGSRVQVGGGKIRGDGSVGAWAFEFCEKWGIVAQAKYPSVDLTTYSQTLCRSWGSRGVPQDIQAVAKNNPVLDGAQVKSADECAVALANAYVVTVASNQGFAMTRDAQGFARAQGSWGHQMCILGYKKGTRPGFLIWNSWGPNWCQGPKGDGDPPDGSFWAEWSVVDRMLKQNDSWAYADVKGFPSRKPDLFLKHAVPDVLNKGQDAVALAW